MAGFQVGELSARPDPALAWRWVVGGNTKQLPFGLPASYVESIDVPFINIQVQSGIFGGGGYTYFPAHHDVAAFSMTFYEDEEGTTLDWIHTWKSKVKDLNSGLMNLPRDYKRDIPVALVDNRGKIYRTIHLEGIWPTDTGNLGLSYNEEGRLTIQQTFSVDNQR